MISIGARLGWRLHAPRRCTGVWAGTHRIPCPARAVLTDSTDPQCPACAAATPGRAVARDIGLGDDGRTYVLYLAWFGPGLIKTGLTAADRGRDRLLEQGAIAWTPLARGAYTPIRRAERLISTAGLAPERLPTRAVASAWWHLPPAGQRAADLTATHQAIATHIQQVSRAEFMPCQVIDQATDFGLGQPPPASYLEVTGLAEDTELNGEIRLIIGRRLLLATTAGCLLIDMRRTAGWAMTNSAASVPTGLTTVTRTQPSDRDDHHDTLF